MSVEETERGLGRATTTGGVTIAGGKQAGVDDGAGRRRHIRMFVIVSHVATSYSALMLPGQKRQRPGKLSPPGPLVRAKSSLQLQATATQPWAREAPVQSRQQQQVASENIVRRLWRSTLGVSIRSRRSIWAAMRDGSRLTSGVPRMSRKPKADTIMKSHEPRDDLYRGQHHVTKCAPSRAVTKSY